MKKYLIVPGKIRSQRDGQIHFISATQLMLLYKVKYSECIVLSGSLEYGFKKFTGVYKNLKVLHPQSSGDYSLN